MSKSKKNNNLVIVATTAVISLGVGGVTKVNADTATSSISSSSTALSTSSQTTATVAEQTQTVQVSQANTITSSSSIDESKNESNSSDKMASSSSSSTTEKINVDSSTTASIQANTNSTAITSSVATAEATKTVNSETQTTDAVESTKATENDAVDGNTITLPSGYGNALEAFYKSGTEDDSELVELVAKSLDQNTYKTNMADADVKITDIDNLTQAQRVALSEFAAGLINQVRDQLGTVNITVSKGALDFAQAVAKRYDSDNWELFDKNEHDVAAISTVAGEYGLVTGSNYYEDLSEGFLTSNIATNNISLDNLKSAIYYTITYMLFADSGSNWQHSLSITNVAHYSTTDSMEYFAFATDKYGQIHLEFIAPDLIQDATRFDTATEKLDTDKLALSDKLTTKDNLLANTSSNTSSKRNKEIITKDNANATFVKKEPMSATKIEQKSKVAALAPNKVIVNKTIATGVKAQKITTLPQTGTINNSEFSIIGAIIVAITGLFGLRYKKRKFF